MRVIERIAEHYDVRELPLGRAYQWSTEQREHVGPRRGTVDLLIEATRKLGPCQVRSKTSSPCPRQAVVEIWGMPFCECCAREQEAYFAIGELTQEGGGWGLRDEALDETLGKMRWERTGYTAAEEAKVMVGNPE
jgi:hypothetical protein